MGRRGLSPLTKCMTTIRILTYGISTDCVDEYLKIGESTAMECMKNFATGVIQVLGEEYLRKPTQADVDHLLVVAEARDFPGMLGSIDCMHWEWKNYPTEWKGAFVKGIYRVPTIILEAVTSYDLWIWHAFSGCPDTLDDINVLDRSPVYQEFYEGQTPKCRYVVKGRKYNIGYYFSDGVYPRWATFVKTVPFPQIAKDRLFVERQEAVKKDVEREFRVLQSRFAIVRGPTRNMDRAELGMIIKVCIILHNMIVEDERDSYDLAFEYEDVEGSIQEPIVRRDHHPCYVAYYHKVVQIHDLELHACLQSYLKQEIWKRHTAQQGSQL